MIPYKIKSISDYHKILGISKPEHPLISVVNLEEFKPVVSSEKVSVIFDFYIISMKRNLSGNVKYYYGQQEYDFDEGTLFFISPGKIFSFEADEDFKSSGWILLIHPDYLWNTSLAKTIKQYEYFNYSVNESLFLSEKEEMMLTALVKNITQEYHSNIDKFSQDVIIAQLELLLTYGERFYQRQFLTRKISSHRLLDKLNETLADFFSNENLIKEGLPSVQFISDKLNVSPNYLSSLLRSLTGQNTQQHIHEKLIEKAKEKLSTTELSISEIAYQLGFEHSQSFSRLFKLKTNISPIEFRASFN